ncbi:MAG TPA: cation:dicarboxylase symporter family transporter [Longimicrobium sp.]|nr:cation:dicarboxylase symporter family transporter [Longimicrobium sp.]
MNLVVILNLGVFALALARLARRQKGGASLSGNVLAALLLGAVLGVSLQAGYGHGHAAVTGTIDWVGVVGGGYVRLLQMIVMPLVLVSTLSAVTRLDDARALGRISAGVLGVLMATTAVSALIGVGVARLFRLDAGGLALGARELEQGAAIQAKAGEVADVPRLLLSFIPTNPFADLAGSRPTSLIGVVVFASLLGLAALALRRESPETGARVIDGMEVLQRLVMRLVRMVIRLTPFGVLALMTKVAATSSPDDILRLARFVAASYLGLALILLAHAALLALTGIDPLAHFRTIWPVLTFAFSSRSSAATIPLNVEAQVGKLGVPPAIANFSASFGATIGQNGCAGLYPAMLAVMIAPGMGIDPTAPGWILTLVLVVTLGSFGIAGVGGGATFAAIVVLSTLNLPIALAGLLISIEPLIDMGRTAVNVSGAMTAGVVTSRLLHDAPTAAPGPVPVPAPAAAGLPHIA